MTGRITVSQKAAMHRASKGNGHWRIETAMTARALIRKGLMRHVTLPIAPTKGIAITLTDKGHAWLVNNC